MQHRELIQQLLNITDRDLDTIKPPNLHLLDSVALSSTEIETEATFLHEMNNYESIVKKFDGSCYVTTLLQFCQLKFKAVINVKTEVSDKPSENQMRLWIHMGEETLIEGFCPKENGRSLRSGIAYTYIRRKLPFFARLLYLRVKEPDFLIKDFISQGNRNKQNSYVAPSVTNSDVKNPMFLSTKNPKRIQNSIDHSTIQNFSFDLPDTSIKKEEVSRDISKTDLDFLKLLKSLKISDSTVVMSYTKEAEVIEEPLSVDLLNQYLNSSINIIDFMQRLFDKTYKSQMDLQITTINPTTYNIIMTFALKVILLKAVISGPSALDVKSTACILCLKVIFPQTYKTLLDIYAFRECVDADESSLKLKDVLPLRTLSCEVKDIQVYGLEWLSTQIALADLTEQNKRRVNFADFSRFMASKTLEVKLSTIYRDQFNISIEILHTNTETYCALVNTIVETTSIDAAVDSSLQQLVQKLIDYINSLNTLTMTPIKKEEKTQMHRIMEKRYRCVLSSYQRLNAISLTLNSLTLVLHSDDLSSFKDSLQFYDFLVKLVNTRFRFLTFSEDVDSKSNEIKFVFMIDGQSWYAMIFKKMDSNCCCKHIAALEVIRLEANNLYKELVPL